MKLAIYGVSRSGKDYLIKDLIKNLLEKGISLYQINGSKMLNDISVNRLGKKFKDLSELDKNKIRKIFIEDASILESKYKNIVVDGHYAFYDDNMKLFDVFTEYDLNFYDLFFYLDTNQDDIIMRMRMSDGEKKNDSYQPEDIIAWKNYEIEKMTKNLISINKELHIIEYTDSFTLDYIHRVINKELDSSVIAKKLVKSIGNIDKYSSVILVDCDKTLSYEDSTSIAMKYVGVEGDYLKTIYNYDRYSNFQACLARKYYESNNVFTPNSKNHVINNIKLNNNLIDDLKSKNTSLIVAITGGNPELWSKILDSTKLDVQVLDSDMIMSKYIKYYVLKELQSLGKYVITMGDSILDSLMLIYANKSYIIANKGKRENIECLLKENTNIHQLAYCNYIYDFVPVDDNIGNIKCLDSSDKEITRNISICKSDSGIEGKLLRDAHYYLGGKIAALVETDYPDDEFVVVIMLRSGLPFGMGISDYFDCPIVFYDDVNINKFEDEFYSDNRFINKKIILCDGVINSGKSIKEIIAKMKGYSTIITTNVISSKFSVDYIHPVYATRISSRSFTGAKQRVISEGKGPDTSDRLFRTL